MTNPLSIVIVGPAHPYRGGIAANNDRLAQELMRMGHKVKIYTFSLQYPSFLFPGKTQYTTEPKPEGLDIEVAVNSINPITWLKVGRRIRKDRPDMLLIRYWLPFMAPCFGSIARIAKGNGHTRVISVADNIIPHEKRVGDKVLSKFWASSTNGFVVMSHSVGNDLKQLGYSRPIGFCHHPLFDNFGKAIPKDEAKSYLKLDASYSYMLFFGLIRDYKGLDWLLEAMSDPRIRARKVKLLVAGEFYADAKVYYDLVAQHKLEDVVAFYPEFIPDPEVAKFFCAADIVVQPYKHATQSGVTQIGYHFSKPMLVTKVGGLAEIIPDGKVGYVVEPNVRAIADAIDNFYEEGREQAMALCAEQEKAKYSWENMANEILRVFEASK
jgi:glycosyltransferase involved in cell wall biosynthesis